MLFHPKGGVKGESEGKAPQGPAPLRAAQRIGIGAAYSVTFMGWGIKKAPGGPLFMVVPHALKIHAWAWFCVVMGHPIRFQGIRAASEKQPYIDIA